MATLYELTSEFEQFSDLLGAAELDEETSAMLADALENLKEDIELKLDSYAKAIKNKQALMQARKDEIDRLKAANDADKRAVDRMKSVMHDAMVAVIPPDKDGKIREKTAFASYWIQKNPEAVVIDEPYLENIPAKYLVPKDPEINRKLLLEDLKNNQILPSLEGIAHIEQTEGVRFK